MVTFDLVLPTLVATVERWADVNRCEKCCVVRDLQGRVRMVLAPKEHEAPDLESLGVALRHTLEDWFAGPVLTTKLPRERGALAKTLLAHARAWDAAGWTDESGAPQAVSPGRWFKVERRLSKFDWLSEDMGGAAWGLGDGPPIITFYSFKGGVGRTTALAACAWQLARFHGKRVAVVDLDLEAPGIGRLLGVSEPDRGVVDYLVDYFATERGELELLPAQALGAEASSVDVLPAGRLDAGYLEKLARLDFGGGGGFMQADERPMAKALRKLLNRLKGRKYDFILLDARAGLHDLAGLSLHGHAHVDVLVGRATEQSYQGLDLTLRALARRRPVNDLTTLLVHSLVPPGEVGSDKKQRFLDRCYELFKEHVYDQFDDQDIPQLPDTGVPHTPYPVTRVEALDAIDTVADPGVEAALFSEAYQTIVERLVELCEYDAPASMKEFE